MSGTGQLPELDSLRSQLADVAQELAERDRTLQEQATHHDRELQDLREQAVLLRAMVEGTAAETGDDFLTSLVTQLTSTLQVHYALVGRITPDQPRSIRTIAVSAGGIVVDNFEYPLAQTPCEAALAQPFTYFAHHVQSTFPQFTRLVELGVDNYCGVPIRTKGGAVIGVLAVMDRKPLPHTDWLPSLLTVFAARAGAELQREQAEEGKLEAERRLRFTQFAMDHAVDGVLWADDSRQFMYANDAACRSLGYSREELLGLRIADIAPHHDPERFQRRLDAIKQGGAATYESVHRRKDGTEFPVEVSVTYLEHEGKDYTCGIIRDITERKRVEQERLQALADLQNIMETIPDIMFTLDTNGNLMRWNSRLALVTEYEPEELLNKSALAFVPVEEQARTAAAIQQAFTEGYAELDGHLLTKTGLTIPYHWNGAILRNAAGTIIGITGIGRDISEQKQAQVELAHRRRHLVKAQALAHLGSCEWDIESGEIVWSDEHYRIFGHEPRTITVTYDTFLAALLPDDHDRVLAAMNEALLGKAPYDIECRIVRPTGEIRTIHCRADLTRDHSGHPVTMSGTVLDVTERHQIEAALRASEERWQLAIQGSNDGIWDWNLQSGDIFFSSQWKAMRGFADQEIRHHIDEWRSRIHPDDLDRVLQSLEAYLNRQRPEFREEYRVQRKDGSFMWILDRGVALWDDDGTPVRMAGSEKDISERKHHQQLLAAERRILEMISTDAPLTEVLSSICLMIQDLSAEARCSILLLDQDGLHLRHGAAPALPEAYIQAINGSRIGPSAGSCGTAAFLGRQVIVTNIAQDPLWADYRTLALSHGLQACWSTPIVSKAGTVLGTFALYYPTPQQPSEAELRLLEQATHLADIAIERTRAADALRQSVSRFDLAVQGSRDGLWYAERVSDDLFAPQNPMYYSPRMKEIMGVPDNPTSDTLATWLSLVHPDDLPRVLQALTKHLEHRSPYDVEYRIIQHGTGCIRWIGAKGQAVWDPTGQPIRMAGSFSDITHRKQAEDALRRSKAQLCDILENNPAVVYTRQAGEGWPHTFITPNIYQLLGYTSIDILSRPELWDSLMHPDDLAELMAQYLPSLLRTGVQTFVTRLRHRDGHYRWVENQARLSHLHDGPLLMVGTMTDVTERMRAEEALRESEARNRSILESVLDAVISIDDRGVIIGWNPQAEVLFGYAAEEVLGLPLDETIIPARYRQAHAHGVNRILQSGHGTPIKRRFEFSALHRNGFEFPVEFAIASTHINGRHTFSAFVRDITERTRAETALRESEERYRTLIEFSPSGVFVLCEGRTVYVNSMAISILSATGPDDILERPPFDFIHPDYHEEVANNLRRVLSGEASVHRAERVYLKMDGTPINVQVEAVRITWNGKPAVQGFFSDITERKRAEEALRHTNSMLQALIETSPLALIGLDQDGTNVTQWNPAAEKIFGWRADEVLGHPLPYVPPNDESRSHAVWEQTARTGVLIGHELRRLRKDGSLIDVALWSTVLKDAHGVATGTFSFIADITDRKRTEEALKRSERQLRTVLDTLPIGVWFTDDQGHVLYGNPVGQRIWADAARVGLPQPGGDTLWWETLEKAESPHRWAVGTVIARGHDMPNEMLELETSTGSRRTIRNSAVAVKDDAGTILGAIVLNEDITDRVRAEQALRQEHALVMAVMDAATDIIFVKDLEGRYIHMNRAGAHTLGMAVEEVIGWNDYALWPSDLAASCQLADRHVLGTGESITVEETSVSNGTTTIYLTTKAPYRDPEGRIIGIIGVARDITERKRAEEALRSSEERFAKAFRSSPYPIGITEMDTGYCIDVNDACLELFGFRRDEVIGSTTLLLGIWPDPKKRERLIEQLHSGRPVRNLDMSFRTHSGELHHILVSSDFIELNGKRCLITVGNDITEQKRAEQNLQRSHAFIRQIIDTDPNFIFAKDRDGRFTLVNKAVAEAYGTTVDALIGKTDADFNGNVEEVAFFLSKDRDVLEHLQDQFIPEERITDAHGAVRWLQTVKRPILDESGKATMVLGASTDITERKQIEEALRQRERDLRAAIEERERISQDLHDGILQSLYAVGLGLEACKPLMTQRHYKKAVATMGEAIGQLNHVMREIRNFIAGLESQVLQGSTFPAALQEMVHTLAATHSLRCAVDLDETVASHISTEQALHLLNIVREALSNSLRHARATKATVSLKPLSRSLRLSISDNGIGFDPASISGVGHGLTNMAARARKVGGRFTVRAAPHRGTRIIIDLPKENIHA